MDYAIIEFGGKQYRVEKGDSVVVDRVDADQGAKVSPRPLLYSGNGKTIVEGPELEKVKIEAVVTEHLRGEKIRVFKYRPKKRYRRTRGHRSALTRLEIRDIKVPGARSAAATDESRKRESEPSSRGKAQSARAAGGGAAKKKEPAKGRSKKESEQKQDD
jgi:large subunit ribosomal protein L21